MDTNELKKLLKGSTAVLILDNGEPSYVILGYDSYKSLLSDQEQEKEVKINHRSSLEMNDTNNLSNSAGPARFQQRISEKESEFLEKINKQILALKSEIDKEEKTTLSAGID